VPPRAVQATAAIGVRKRAARIGAALRAATGVRKRAAVVSMTRAGPPTEAPRTVAATALAIKDTEAAVGAASLTADGVMVRSITAPEGTAVTASAARIEVRRTITPRGMGGTSVIGSTAAIPRDTTLVHGVTAAGATATLTGAAPAVVASAITLTAAVSRPTGRAVIMDLAVAAINNTGGAADTASITGKGEEVSPALIM
jgi:hypothetical protein